jgi:hypothetical protein
LKTKTIFPERIVELLDAFDDQLGAEDLQHARAPERGHDVEDLAAVFAPDGVESLVRAAGEDRRVVEALHEEPVALGATAGPCGTRSCVGSTVRSALVGTGTWRAEAADSMLEEFLRVDERLTRMNSVIEGPSSRDGR